MNKRNGVIYVTFRQYLESVTGKWIPEEDPIHLRRYPAGWDLVEEDEYKKDG